MCLAIPMRVVSVDAGGAAGEVEYDGLRRRAELSLVPGVAAGDYVIVHAGFAIEKLDVAAAEEQIALFKELADSLP